jgi:RNA binding exosome subunit
LSSSPSKYLIAYATIRVFSHATEDPQKVETAIRNTLPEALTEDLGFTQTSLTGHHNNPIIIFEAKLEDKQNLPKLLEKFASLLSSLDKQQLETAYMGKLKLGNVDPIHFKIHFKNRTPQEITEICHEAGLLP